MSDQIILECKNLTRTYLDSGEHLKVLDGLDFQLLSGEIAAITGASGSGKSTLLNILATLDRPDSGEVYYRGELLDLLNHDRINLWRSKSVGFVFQFHHLLPEFTLLENILLPARQLNGFSKDDELRARHLLEMVGIADRAHHMPNECSGGERQRAAMARALINQPSLILADEPSGNLDRQNTQKLHDLIEELNQKLGQSFIIVTHDDTLAKMAHRHWNLVDGKLVLQN